MILLGYSIRGPVISGVAEDSADRIGHLFYLDAYVRDAGLPLLAVFRRSPGQADMSQGKH